MIKWKTENPEDHKLANKIARRLYRKYPSVDIVSVQMDIIAVHTCGCPLKLSELLKADDFNFEHDVFGICSNIDRLTGELKNFFLPRYAQ